MEATGRYWKLVCNELSANGGVEVVDIQFTDKDFAYATPEYPDMTALKAAIATEYREDLYTEDSLATYHAALKKAQKLLVLPYATAAMVTETTKALTDAGEALTLRDLGTVMTSLTLSSPTITVRKQTMGTPWTSFATAIDVAERDLSKLYLFFTLDIDLAEGERAGMFTSGRIYLRSANTDGKENSAYCTIDALNLHEGENIIYLPLSALTKQNNVMDWTDVSSFRMYIDSVNQYDMDMSFTFSEIQILDSENRIPDSPEKVALKQYLRAQKTDLTIYTLESAAAYNALFEQGWAVYRDSEATTDAVNAMLTAVKAADDLLVLDENAKEVLGVLQENEITSNEAHYMKVDIKAPETIDISGYEEGQVYLQFDFRVDTTHTDPAPSNDDWLKKVLNGKVEMGETDKAVRTVVVNPFHTYNVLTKSASWTTLRYPIPAALIEKGSVQSFYTFLYNDTGALGTDADGITWDSGSGVTFSVRNIKILADKAEDVVPSVDKTALNNAIASAEEKLADGKTYTAATLAALNTALSEAKGLATDADQTAVDNATAKLNAAITGLQEEPVVTVLLGDVNGNGEITAEDALLALQTATGKVTLTPDQIKAADVVDNDGVTANDALLILQYATKKIAQF